MTPTTTVGHALTEVAGIAEVPLFAGYAGCGPLQLEDEMDQGAWWCARRRQATSSPRNLTTCGTGSWPASPA